MKRANAVEKIGADRLAQCRVTTKLQIKKNISICEARQNAANKSRYASSIKLSFSNNHFFIS